MPDKVVLIVTGPATVTTSVGVSVVYGTQRSGASFDILDQMTTIGPDGKKISLTELKKLGKLKKGTSDG